MLTEEQLQMLKEFCKALGGTMNPDGTSFTVKLEVAPDQGRGVIFGSSE